MTLTLPLSLYVHLPWCVQKCPYCDFNSHKAGAAADKSRYLAALLADLRFEALRAGDRLIESVFFGGGTPSFFSAGEIGQLLDRVASSLKLAANAEITMEANPGTIERDQLADYRRAGINRLSLGAQSFSDESLRRLGRIHGAGEILQAWCDAEKAGFDSLNIDLMYALPGQTLDMATFDLERAVQLSPQHVSWYQLTLEPNTVFYAKPPPDLPNEDLSWDIGERGHELLSEAGFLNYETSAFAKPGFECRHNLNYWQFGDYLAAGAGAHGKYTDGDGAVWRYRKPAHPASYMKASEAGQLDGPLRRLAQGDLAFEFMLNALRLTRGFRASDFVSRTGLDFNTVAPRIEQAISRGLLCRSGNRNRREFCPTALGRRFLNDLQALFLPDPAPHEKAKSPRAMA